MHSRRSKTTTKKSKKTKRESRSTNRDRLLSALLQSPDGRSMLALGGKGELTTADAVAPPGSFLGRVVREFQDQTDLPPILAVASTLAIVGASLAEAQTTVVWHDDNTPTEIFLWLIMLAGSGDGKTWTKEVISEALSLKPSTLNNPGSPQKMIDLLADASGRILWMRDEYGQAIEEIKRGGPTAGLRDVMLQAYDHTRLSNSTRAHGDVVVDRPVLNVFGSSVLETWGSQVDANMLLDGFVQRHLFVVADSRPLEVPRYPREQMVAHLRAAAGDLAQRIAEGGTYVISEAAAEAYKEMWHELVGSIKGKLNRSYLRRITWSAVRYACIYHLLLGRPGRQIGATAMRWAWRMTMLHCHSTRLVLALSDRSLAGRIELISGWVEQHRAAGVDVYSARFARTTLQRFRRDFTSINDVTQMIQFCARAGAADDK